MIEHERFMRIALTEAEAARHAGEIPVGAVLVSDGDGAVIARAHNLCKTRRDPTAHAELLCLSEGAQKSGGRLDGCTLYVTMEPCAMCAGAAVNARLRRLVFGAYDARCGCCGSVIDLTDRCFYHSVEIWGGVLETECAALLTGFFAAKRD